MSIVLDGSNQGTVGNINSATAQNSTSGTALTFAGIPSGVKRITVIVSGLQTSGSANKTLRLGTSGGVVSTGYTCGSVGINGASGATFTNGFSFNSTSSSHVLQGEFVLTNITGNTWLCQASFCTSDSSNQGFVVNGSVTLSGLLTQLVLTTSNGTDTFTAGSVNILYE